MNEPSPDILLVEDNPNDAMLAIRSLTESKIANKIVHLTDGQAALDYLFCEGTFSKRDPAEKPKVILLDLKLPKVSGLQVLKRIRSQEVTRLLPVVILTSSQEESDLVESYKLGANSFIVKPLDFENFSKSIKQVGLYWLLLNKPPLIQRSS